MATPGLDRAFNAPVYAIAFQNDGHFFVSGRFTRYLGQTTNGIIYVCPNGSLDASFLPGVGFEVGGVYYPPTRLLPTVDGGVICVLADTYLIERKGSGVLTKMRYRGQDVPPVVKLLANGDLDTDFNPSVEIGDTIRSAVLLGETRLLVVKPGEVFILHLETFEKARLVTNATDVFYDGVGVRDNQVLIMGKQMPVTSVLQRGTLDLVTVSASAFPYEMAAWLTDYSFNLEAGWKSESLRANGKYGLQWDAARVAWDAESEKAAIGTFLTTGAVHGTWDQDASMQQRGMLLLQSQEPGAPSTCWDTRFDTLGDPVKQGFEPSSTGGAVGFYAAGVGSLYTVNPLTGVYSLVGSGLSCYLYVCVVVGSTVYYVSLDRKLYTFTGGVETLVAALAPATYTLTGVSLHSDGFLYGFAQKDASANTFFVKVNKTTGAITELATLPGTYTVVAAAAFGAGDVLYTIGYKVSSGKYMLLTYDTVGFTFFEVAELSAQTASTVPSQTLAFSTTTLYGWTGANKIVSVHTTTGVVTVVSTITTNPGQNALGSGVTPLAASVDPDSYYIIAVPFLVREEDGSVYVTALFGSFRNEGLTAFRLYKIDSDGTRDTGFTCPTLANADASTGRVFAVALSPNRLALLLGGRFDRINGVVAGHIVAVDVLTGAVGEYNLSPYAKTQFTRGAGTRGFVFTAVAEDLYMEVSDR